MAENADDQFLRDGSVVTAAKTKVMAFQVNGQSDENQTERLRLETEARQAAIEAEQPPNGKCFASTCLKNYSDP